MPEIHENIEHLAFIKLANASPNAVYSYDPDTKTGTIHSKSN